MKKIALFILFPLSIAFAWLNFSAAGKRVSALYQPKRETTFSLSPDNFSKLKLTAIKAKKFAQENNFNSSFCFLIDMSLPSYQKRFFIYDLEKDSIKNSGLVTHGRCNEDWLEGRKYGNDVGCGCTSIGKYKIGNAYSGRFGLAFKLYGLDKTNNNAFARFVVLHSHSCVPETEVSSDICQSDGCPTVSPGFLKKIEPLIKGSSKPILLWILD